MSNAHQETGKKGRPTLFLLILLISFGSIGGQLFTPGLPAIEKTTSASAGVVVWTVTIYLLGYSIGQLIYGPLANSLGRKGAILTGIGVSIFGSICCIIAGTLGNIEMLLVSRLIMALGGSCGLVMTYTLISDAYHSTKAREMVSYATSSFAIMPGLAIFLGGILVEYIGWLSCFYFLTAYGIFVFFYVLFKLQETLPYEERTSFHLGKVCKSLIFFFRHGQLMNYAFLMGCGTAIVYLYASLGPMLGIKVLGLSPDQYGFYSLLPSFGLFLGTMISAKIVKVLRARKVIGLGLLIMVASIIALDAFYAGGHTYTIVFFASMFFIYIGGVFAYTNSIVLATEGIEDRSSASSAMTFVNMGIGTLGTFIGGLSHENLIVMVPLLFSITVVVQIIFFGITRIYPTEH